jgi:hypothetical protein
LTLNSQSPVVENILPQIYGEEKISKDVFDDETEILGDDIIESEKEVKIGHSSPFKVVSIKQKAFKIIKHYPEAEKVHVKVNPIFKETKEQISEDTTLLSKLQESLKSKLWTLSSSKGDEKEKLLSEIKTSLDQIDEIKSKTPVNLENLISLTSSIVPSLEYQTCLATKFSQMLFSMYRSDPSHFDSSMNSTSLFESYPMSEIIYDLYVVYILKNSQTSSANIHTNDVYILIKNVLLQSMKGQHAVDELVIRILRDFILKSDKIFSQVRIIETIENLEGMNLIFFLSLYTSNNLD